MGEIDKQVVTEISKCMKGLQEGPVQGPEKVWDRVLTLGWSGEVGIASGGENVRLGKH